MVASLAGKLVTLLAEQRVYSMVEQMALHWVDLTEWCLVEKWVAQTDLPTVEMKAAKKAELMAEMTVDWSADYWD